MEAESLGHEQAPGTAPRAIYRAYGLRLSCDFPLPELPEDTHSGSDLQIRLATEMAASGKDEFMRWTTAAGEPWVSFYKNDERFVLRFAHTADFSISRAGDWIECVKCETVPWHTLRHLLLDQVLPMVMNLRGGEALHASAVITRDGAIAFCGRTGSGKSTMAAIFAEAGDPILTDDCLALSESRGTIFGAPGYRGLRLWNEVIDEFGWRMRASGGVAHYTSKRRICVDDVWEFPSDPQALRAIYVLERDDAADAVGVEEMSMRDRMMGLLSYAFRLDTTDAERLAAQFKTLERYAGIVPVRKLRLPRNPQRLPGLRSKVLADLAGQAEETSVECSIRWNEAAGARRATREAIGLSPRRAVR